jgi:hypothetical protein
VWTWLLSPPLLPVATRQAANQPTNTAAALLCIGDWFPSSEQIYLSSQILLFIYTYKRYLNIKIPKTTLNLGTKKKEMENFKQKPLADGKAEIVAASVSRVTSIIKQ